MIVKNINHIFDENLSLFVLCLNNHDVKKTQDTKFLDQPKVL